MRDRFYGEVGGLFGALLMAFFSSVSSPEISSWIGLKFYLTFYFTRDILVSRFLKSPLSSNYHMIIVLKNIFCFDTIFLQLLVYHGNLCLTSSQLSYFDSGVIIASIQELKRWGKKAHLDSIYKRK